MGKILLMNKTETRTFNYPNFPYGKRNKGWALVIRYGAFGDHIVASCVLPYLKRDGYRIAYNTTEWGYETHLRNPHIDEFWLQKTDEIKNPDLGDYWKKLGEGFEKVVQLNQSIEVDCVAVQTRECGRKTLIIDRKFPFLKYRDKYNKNFYENNIKRAGYEPILPIRGELYPSEFESRLVRNLIDKKAKGKFKVMWCLAGSGMNKGYPWAEYAIVEFLSKYKDAVVFTVGDEVCGILHIDHPRVFNRMGAQTMRISFAMVPYMDCVVSPDTGILHAAGCYDEIDKITIMSVNTEENVTKHFKNCVTLCAHDVPCYPCHTLIYVRDKVCPIGRTGASMCMERIYPDKIVKELEESYQKRRINNNGENTYYRNIKNRNMSRENQIQIN